MSDLFIGLMSGTSLDGADVALVDFAGDRCEILAAETTPFPVSLAASLRELATTPECTLERLGMLDTALGEFFGQCVRHMLTETDTEPERVAAIGHSGHTIFHKPARPDAFTMQLGDPNAVAAQAGIQTVADFRRTDVAYGGQGAPLTPSFHEWCFANEQDVRVVLNLGGVANITILDPTKSPRGFDTGPANSLIDGWSRRCWEERFDTDGRRASKGRVIKELLTAFLDDPYFATEPPKSTGFEYFNLAWVDACLASLEQNVADQDVLTTLTELTAVTVSSAIHRSTANCRRLILCGGGTFNRYLVDRLRHNLGTIEIESSAAHGVPPEWVEAAAFAWLARKRLRGEAGNVASVTGARHSVVLGGLYSPTRVKEAQ